MIFWFTISIAALFTTLGLVLIALGLPVGTRSVLFGAHCLFLHPWFVARAWWQLYGFPRDPRLWVAFFVHDIGYLGKPNMDGPEGEGHVFLGAKILGRLFDYDPLKGRLLNANAEVFNWVFGRGPFERGTWYCFSFYHSRFMAKRYGFEPSRLCYADKLSIVLTPAWLYLPMAYASGEIREYLAKNKNGKYAHMNIYNTDAHIWYQNMQDYLRKWAWDHKNGEVDNVTEVTDGVRR